MGRSAPIRSKRGQLKVTPHPALRSLPRSSQSSASKGATPRVPARFAGLVSRPFGPVSRSPTRAHERRRFRLVKASETFCGWSSAPTRKKSYGHPRNLKRCGLLCSPMAKVENCEGLRKVSRLPLGTYATRLLAQALRTRNSRFTY